MNSGGNTVAANTRFYRGCLFLVLYSELVTSPLPLLLGICCYYCASNSAPTHSIILKPNLHVPPSPTRSSSALISLGRVTNPFYNMEQTSTSSFPPPPPSFYHLENTPPSAVLLAATSVPAYESPLPDTTSRSWRPSAFYIILPALVMVLCVSAAITFRYNVLLASYAIQAANGTVGASS